jgi:hypothetical protein
VEREASAGRNGVVIEDPQRAKRDIGWVVVIGKREVPISRKPFIFNVIAVSAADELNHGNASLDTCIVTIDIFDAIALARALLDREIPSAGVADPQYGRVHDFQQESAFRRGSSIVH